MLSTAVPASAGDAPGAFERLQQRVDFTVYAPTATFGLPLANIRHYDCGPTEGLLLSATYGRGRDGVARKIGLFESAQQCQDGPDGIALVATFRVRGSTAKLFGDCSNDRPTCAPSDASVRRGGYVQVTLPSAGSGRGSTYVELYSHAVTRVELKAFVRGLVPVR
jgi:hypothetical protein